MTIRELEEKAERANAYIVWDRQSGYGRMGPMGRERDEEIVIVEREIYRTRDMLYIGACD